jgi:hypothetical protein
MFKNLIFQMKKDLVLYHYKNDDSVIDKLNHS